MRLWPGGSSLLDSSIWLLQWRLPTIASSQTQCRAMEGSLQKRNRETQAFGGVGGGEGFYSPDLRGELGAGLLDLNAMDDTELFSEHGMSLALESSSFFSGGNLDKDLDIVSSRARKVHPEASVGVSAVEKEPSVKETNIAKIKVVVRKRPLNKKEISRKEDDIVSVHDSTSLSVHEPKLKVDLTAYVENHEFCFDAVLDEQVSNDEVYRVTVEPIIPTLFQKTKATCFAYGQTGSGKTFTMQPLPLRASHDILRLLNQPIHRNQKLRLWLSYFEIYGGKLFDLLSERRKLCMREDGRQQVCIVGLQEFEVSDVQIVREYIEKGNTARSTGSTGANEESSRSHAILQLVIKKHKEAVAPSSRRRDAKASVEVVGKISFIDLAGSERGADTTDNDRQTRIEGAEINKSLLALKECIRALDNDQSHIPFRGSKLTEVLRDSFVGNSRTIMISCISPNAGSCEHTLNTLRYADRVKSLSQGVGKRDHQPSKRPEETRVAPVLACETRPIEEEEDEEEEEEEEEPSMAEDAITALLEEEEALIAAHRKEIEDTMEIVREEMKLLAEVDRPGSLIDNYVNQLSFVLSRKAAGLVTLQACLARFQHRLKQQEILSTKKIPR
ncbi:P-loop containing nucleoside triphosphate hydrolases superfamily protein isoform X2 [Wolffia australiana]